MPPRKELCRNFQRGSCQYGDRCKFLHAAPTQQSKPSNPFGFGVQTGNSFQGSYQQQQVSNPFGFGVQKNTPSRGSTDYGSKPTQFKPFENKWIRDSSLSNNTSSASKQSGNQPQADDHKCTDPEACKRMIIEGLENEKPQWKLSCYGHCRYGPCDITGDISYEELRALAYDDAKDGKTLQYIIERERSLVNSKLAEFQSLAQRSSTVSSFGRMGSNFTSINSSSSAPALGFSQFGQQSRTGNAAVPVHTFGQSNLFQNNQPSSNFVISNSPFNGSGSFGIQSPQVSVQSSFSFGQTNSGLVATTTTPANPFSTFANASTAGNVPNVPRGFTSNTQATATEHPDISLKLNNITSGLNETVDDKIWTKAEWKWNTGEIPEEPPPDVYIH